MNQPMSKPVADALARFVARLVRAGARPSEVDGIPADLRRVDSLWLCFRVSGRSVLRGWHDGRDLIGILPAAVDAARSALGEDVLASVTTVEMFLPDGRSFPYTEDMSERAQSNALRHRFGLALRHGDAIARLTPLELVSRNLSPPKAFERLAGTLGAPPDHGERLAFSGYSCLIDLVVTEGHPVHRGQPVVAQSEITRDTVQDMADAMTGWLVRQVGPTGMTTYKYWPSKGTYSEANNTIRQFMGSACLALAAGRYPDATVSAACDRNFAYNFRTFYETRGSFAVINEFGKTKLGAAGVAITAILNLPDPGPWQAQLDALLRFVERMQQPDGSFRTFLDPPDRNDNQFFYPGEALLALVMVYARRRDPALLDRIMRGFRYYRDFFRANRNPAFVPWHTQAYCLLHDLTGEQALADFVFEMNDWLLPMQETREDPADILGDFFDPQRPGFGPPHASATGVYLEGLIEAWRLAVALSDGTRAEAYRRSILRGLRMLRQLQFRDGLDMFYLTKRDRVQGGVRTAVFDNTIRIDNVQHGLMAIYRILDRFGPADFRLDKGEVSSDAATG